MTLHQHMYCTLIHYVRDLELEVYVWDLNPGPCPYTTFSVKAFAAPSMTIKAAVWIVVYVINTYLSDT